MAQNNNDRSRITRRTTANDNNRQRPIMKQRLIQIPANDQECSKPFDSYGMTSNGDRNTE